MAADFRVLFRVDASTEVGTGHVMRCLTLAQRLAHRGAFCTFACRESPGHLLDLIAARGFATAPLPAVGPLDWEQDAQAALRTLPAEGCDLLVVDHYQLDARWEQRLRGRARRLLVIDDLADRPHDCDVLLDQNLYEDMDHRYRGLVPASARLFLGPRYVLLAPQFVELRARRRPSSGQVRTLLASFGGADPSAQTGKALDALERLNGERVTPIVADVVVGASNPHRAQLEARCRRLPWVRWHFASDRVAELMAQADLALGAGGTMVWERCAVGLAAVVVVLAANQRDTVNVLAQRGCLLSLGDADGVEAGAMHAALLQLLADPDRVRKMSETSFAVLGPDLARDAETFIDALMAPASSLLSRGSLRPMRLEDAALVLAWRNSERVRLAMLDSRIIEASSHMEWVARVLADATCLYWVFELDARPVGLVYFTQIDETAGVCRWGFYLGEPQLPKGSGTVLGLLALDRLFGSRAIHTVTADVLKSNGASLAMHRKLGFREAAPEPPAQDAIALALTRADFLQAARALDAALSMEGATA